MKNNNSQSHDVRWKLASTITTFSIVGISLIAIVVIVLAPDRASAAQTVLSAVLPLFAAWVSTVLAYYYSKENLEAATQSVKALMSSEEKLQTIFVKEKMINVSDMLYFTYTDDLKVQDMLNRLKESRKGNRFPFIDDKSYPQFVLHKSVIDDALVECSLKNVSIADLTLKDLFDKVDTLKKLSERTFVVVTQNATLADAKAELKNLNGVQDVFVTDNGRKDGAVLGWITNIIIEQSSKV